MRSITEVMLGLDCCLDSVSWNPESLELLILLSSPPKCWEYRHVTPHTVIGVLGINPSDVRQALYHLSYISVSRQPRLDNMTRGEQPGKKNQTTAHTRISLFQSVILDR